MFEPILIRNFYSEDMVDFVNLQMSLLKKSPNVQLDEKEFNRKFFHNHPFFKGLHQLQTKRIEYILERKLKPSYCFTSMYFEGTGKCDKHTDRPQCLYTVDVCFNQNKPWPFFAEYNGKTYKFDMNPGDAIILSGTDHPHWREPIQKENFCDLVFFHYVNPDFEGGLD